MEKKIMTDPVAHALDLFRNGLFCSEAIVQAFNSELDLGFDETTLRVATVFGAGFGGAKCSCGSLTGALVVLGGVMGRTSVDQSVDKTFCLAVELHDAFRSRFGQVCCRTLTRDQEWGAPEHHAYCERYVQGAAEILLALLTSDDTLKVVLANSNDTV